MKPIVIHIPAHFIEERCYALKALFGELLELPITIHVTPGETGYRVVLDQAGEIVIEDHFFNRCSESRGYLHRDMLPSSFFLRPKPARPKNFFHFNISPPRTAFPARWFMPLPSRAMKSGWGLTEEA